MVVPGEYLRIAEMLLAEGSEAGRHSAVSRAYYAAFWHCRELVEARFGDDFEPGVDVHRQVASSLRHWDAVAADELRELRLARNRADYDRHENITQAEAQEWLASATALALLA